MGDSVIHLNPPGPWSLAVHATPAPGRRFVHRLEEPSNAWGAVPTGAGRMLSGIPALSHRRPVRDHIALFTEGLTQ